jgi:hypothetical protein
MANMIEWRETADTLPPEGRRVLATAEGADGLRYNIVAFLLDGEWYLDAGRSVGAHILAWSDQPTPWAGARRGARS